MPRNDKPRRDNPLQKSDDNGGRVKLNGGKRKTRLSIKDPEANRLVAQARPHRQKGEELYKKVYKAGLKNAEPHDVDTAIRKYEAALNLYEEAFIIEDNDAIFALLTGCSRRLFKLRFWKDQIGSR